MKAVIKFTFLVLLVGVLTFISCKKEYSCENCGGNLSGSTNKPPIANAGPDQVITLPTDSVLLDVSASSDPDNSITSYAWTKISGPLTLGIANANVVQAQVTNLLQGIYQFELKVTDAGGLFSKDTMQVIVNAASPPPPASCNPGSRPLINAQLIPFVTSPDNSDISLAAILGNKMVFIRHGIITGGPRGTGILKGYVYDMVTQTWTITQLSEQRWDMGIVAAGNKVFFAGGFDVDGPGNNYYFSVIDIYDASTDSWSVSYLSKPRRLMAATAINNKIFFAGGYGEMSPNNYPVSNLVEICDLSTNSWSVKTLSESRVYLSAVTFGSKIYFAGGINGLNSVTKKVDVYDNSTNTWATFDLQEPKAAMSSIVVDNKIYWAGGVNENQNDYTGYNWTWTSTVEIKDINTGISIAACLFQPNYWPWNNAAVQKNDKIVFFTGADTYAFQNKFDIYDTSTNSWSIGVLPQNIEGTIISINNTIYVSSGSQVWKLEF